MRTVVLIAIVVGHLLFAGSLYLIFGVGQKFAPDIITSQVVVYPLVIGVAGIWIWFTFWSVRKILEAKSTPPTG
jgi:hypothetical protein